MNKFICPCCKYEFERDYSEGEKEKDYAVKGDETPVALYLSNSIKIYKPGNRGIYENDTTVDLYACPKCKTLIVDL